MSTNTKTPPPSQRIEQPAALKALAQEVDDIVQVLNDRHRIRLDANFFRQLKSLRERFPRRSEFHSLRNARDADAVELYRQIEALRERLKALHQRVFKKKTDASDRERRKHPLWQFYKLFNNYLATPSDRYGRRGDTEIEESESQIRGSIADIMDRRTSPGHPPTRKDTPDDNQAARAELVAGLDGMPVLTAGSSADLQDDSIISGREPSTARNAAERQSRWEQLSEWFAEKGYQLESKLGEGGMGAVFEALQKTTGRRVAIKIMTVQQGSTEASDFQKRFIREAQTMVTLSDQDKDGRLTNVISIENFGNPEAPITGIIMELEQGPTVELNKYAARVTELDRLDEGVFHGKKMERAMRYLREACADLLPETTLDRIWMRIVRQIFETAQFIEDMGYQHRDHKPSNLILMSNAADILLQLVNDVARISQRRQQMGRLATQQIDRVFDRAEEQLANAGRLVRIIDFGLVKDMRHLNQEQMADFYSIPQEELEHTDESLTIQHITRAGQAHGTPHYMSEPDLAGEVNDRRDVYALALTAYELAGYPPFSWGADTINTLRAIQDACADADQARSSDKRKLRSGRRKSPSSERLKQLKEGRDEVFFSAIEYFPGQQELNRRLPAVSELLQDMSFLTQDPEHPDLPDFRWDDALQVIDEAIAGKWTRRQKLGMFAAAMGLGGTVLTAVIGLTDASARAQANAAFENERQQHGQVVESERSRREEAEKERQRVLEQEAQEQRVRTRALTMQNAAVSRIGQLDLESADSADQIKACIIELRSAQDLYSTIGERNPSLETALRDARKKLIESLVMGQLIEAYFDGDLERFNRIRSEIDRQANHLHPEGAEKVQVSMNPKHRDIFRLSYAIEHHRTLDAYKSKSSPAIQRAQSCDLSSTTDVQNAVLEAVRSRLNTDRAAALFILLERLEKPRPSHAETASSSSEAFASFNNSKWTIVSSALVNVLINSLDFGENIFTNTPHLVLSFKKDLQAFIQTYERRVHSQFPSRSLRYEEEQATFKNFERRVIHQLEASIIRSKDSLKADLRRGIHAACASLDE